jgi:hypothetical protein
MKSAPKEGISYAKGREEERTSFLKKRSKKLLFIQTSVREPHTYDNKSFLVLFFKKELLPSFFAPRQKVVQPSDLHLIFS